MARLPDGWIITPKAKGRTEIELVPRELVRCKNCKRFPNCCLPPRNDPDWFCADGERKTTDDPSHPFADDVMMGE